MVHGLTINMMLFPHLVVVIPTRNTGVCLQSGPIIFSIFLSLYFSISEC